MSEMNKKGNISVETANIFPIIKKWLYSEKEIFLRELVSNATDAITKMKRLASLGEIPAVEDAFRVTVSFSAAEKTITVADNGIGMTAEELDRYICHMALSGATEFIQKYEGENAANGIIGHFGLGFYSAFMVADRVEVFSRSYTGAPAVHWDCDTESEYTMEETERERGTSVMMHVNSDGEEYLTESKLREILDRYCAFMPIEIYLVDEDKEPEAPKEGEEAKAPTPINETVPLWQKDPKECTEEEYKAFYTKVFADYREPLFYMHIQADYPLNFKGVIYFPKLRENYESLEGKIKLYYNQVFVADNIKEVIPEYLLMLRGVLDCPELPLNVSRSYLQNSGYVTKISAHIVKKVADKLNTMFRQDRESFEKIWRDLKTFVEYGCICDKKFYERVSPSVLLQMTDGTQKTVDEYLEAAKEKHENVIYYTTDPTLQAQYVSLYQAKGIEVAVLDGMVDTRFSQSLEMYRDKLKFRRVDADTSLIQDGEGLGENEALSALFLPLQKGEGKMTVTVEQIADASIPAVITVNEESMRMAEMMKMYAPDADAPFPVDITLVLNHNNPCVKRLAEDGYGEERKTAVAKQIYYLALMSTKKLSGEELADFTDACNQIMQDLA